ncbi:hypothetical protein HDV57DRAFT_494644 [Trichoderma longibrachiatum]
MASVVTTARFPSFSSCFVFSVACTSIFSIAPSRFERTAAANSGERELSAMICSRMHPLRAGMMKMERLATRKLVAYSKRSFKCKRSSEVLPQSFNPLTCSPPSFSSLLSFTYLLHRVTALCQLPDELQNHSTDSCLLFLIELQRAFIGLT